MEIKELNDINQIFKNSRENSKYYIHNGYIFSCPNEQDPYPSYSLMKNDSIDKDWSMIIDGDLLFKFLKDNKKIISEFKKDDNGKVVINTSDSNISFIFPNDRKEIIDLWNRICKANNNTNIKLLENIPAIDFATITLILSKVPVDIVGNSFICSVGIKCFTGINNKTENISMSIYTIDDNISKAVVTIKNPKNVVVKNIFYFINFKNEMEMIINDK